MPGDEWSTTKRNKGEATSGREDHNALTSTGRGEETKVHQRIIKGCGPNWQ